MLVQHMDWFPASAARDGRQELPRLPKLDAHVSRDRGTDLSVSDQHRAGSENPGESSVGMAFQQAGNKGRQRYGPFSLSPHASPRVEPVDGPVGHRDVSAG